MTRKEIFIISLATFLTIVAGVIFDIIHARNESELSPKLQEVIEPLNPSFDKEAIDLLQ